jgi:hypothetical protein
MEHAQIPVGPNIVSHHLGLLPCQPLRRCPKRALVGAIRINKTYDN